MAGAITAGESITYGLMVWLQDDERGDSWVPVCACFGLSTQGLDSRSRQGHWAIGCNPVKPTVCRYAGRGGEMPGNRRVVPFVRRMGRRRRAIAPVGQQLLRS